MCDFHIYQSNILTWYLYTLSIFKSISQYFNKIEKENQILTWQWTLFQILQTQWFHLKAVIIHKSIIISDKIIVYGVTFH